MDQLDISETLSEQYRERLLATRREELDELARVLTAVRILAGRKRGAEKTSVARLQEYVSMLAEGRFDLVLDVHMKKLSKALQQREDSYWEQGGAYSVTALLCAVVAMVVGRAYHETSQQQSNEKIKLASGALVRSLISTLETCGQPTALDNIDRLSIHSLVTRLSLRLARTAGDKDKDARAKLLIMVEAKVEDLIPFVSDLLKTTKGNFPSDSILKRWMQSTTPTNALKLSYAILQKCRNAPDWKRAYVNILEGKEKIGLLLFDEVLRLGVIEPHDVTSSRWTLDAMRELLPAIVTPSEHLIDYMECTATTNGDANIRCQAWKLITRMIYVCDGRIAKRLIHLAADALVVETSKAVGSVLLRLFSNVSMLHATLDMTEMEHILDRVQHFLVAIASSNGSGFPSSWRQEFENIFRCTRGIPSHLIFKAFCAADDAGKALLVCCMRVHLSTCTPEEARHELQSLWARVTRDHLMSMDMFLCHLADSPDSGPIRVILGSIFADETSKLAALSSKDVFTTVSLNSSIFRAISGNQDSVIQGEDFFHRILQKVRLIGSTADEDTTLLACARYLRLYVEQTADRETFEAEIDTIIQILLQCRSTQREAIKLLFALPRPQEQVFRRLALAQEGAFENAASMASFLTLIGVIATENAAYIKRTFSSVADQEQSRGQQDDTDDYMGAFKEAEAGKHRVKQAQEESVCQGLLSAYEPLLAEILESDTLHENSELKLSAIWTIGEFMKMSTSVTMRFFDCILSVVGDIHSPSDMRALCVDVWAQLQPVMRPSDMKERGIAWMYQIVCRTDNQSASDETFRLYLLKKLQTLILGGQIRDDRLAELAISLNFESSEWQTSIVEFFRRYFAKLSSEKVCRILFGMHFIMESLRSAKEAQEATCQLVDLARRSGCQVDQLHVALATEAKEPSRRLSALALLACMTGLSRGAIDQLVDLTSRGDFADQGSEAGEYLRMIFSKELQRCREKNERSRLRKVIGSITAPRTTSEGVRVDVDNASIEKFLCLPQQQ